LIFAGIGALAVGFVLGLQALPPGVSATVASQTQDLAAWAPRGSQIPFDRRWHLASLDTAGLLEFAPADNQSAWARSTGRGDFAARDSAVNSDADSDADDASFDERFASLFGWPTRRSIVEVEERANPVPLPLPNPGGRAAPHHAVAQSAPGPAQLATLPPAGAAKKPVRLASLEDSIPSPDTDSRTAIYDISAHRVYLPNGQWLEAHSGLGERLDDPRYVSERGRGATPPNVYDLTLREELFHGVRALRLTPVGSGAMYGREGLLAHSYMLGPNGQSNGCVSFNDYEAFLNAYLRGEIDRLVVVEHLANPPGPRTALGWIPQSIRALFGRS
jgi:hypothetical protein